MSVKRQRAIDLDLWRQLKALNPDKEKACPRLSKGLTTREPSGSLKSLPPIVRAIAGTMGDQGLP